MKRSAWVLPIAALLAACSGDGDGGGESSPPPPSPAPVAKLELVAGATGGLGFADGAYKDARFFEPSGVSFDGGGTLYVADKSNNRIRKGTGGVISTLAGNGMVGFVDGPGALARFWHPRGVAGRLGGNVYVADSSNHAIRQISPDGFVSTLAGPTGVRLPDFADGQGSQARFNDPRGIALDATGNLYVADSLNHVIRRISPAGLATTIAGVPKASGSNDGPAQAARFSVPTALDIDDAGNLYIADSGNQAIRKLSVTGTVTTIGGRAGEYGIVDGPVGTSRFENPQGIAVGFDGTVYVSEISSSVIRQISPAGVTSPLAGVAGQPGNIDGRGSAARLNWPAGIGFNKTNGTIYVAEWLGHTVRAVTRDGEVSTPIGAPPPQGAVDGPGASARFANPAGLAVDPAGNVVVADSGNAAVRRVDSTGTVQTVVGALRQPGSQDGPLSSARLLGPIALAYDAAGTLYLIDREIAFCIPAPVPCDSPRTAVRKVTAAGVTLFAGSFAASGIEDGVGTAARFRQLAGIAVDAAGNVYVSDTLAYTIRKITPAGVVTTFAGLANTPDHVDGPAAQARLLGPRGLVADRSGNLYVADANARIRKITPEGEVSTLAGSGSFNEIADGTGTAAKFGNVSQLAIDADGNLYAADLATIRKITPAGVVTTIAGMPDRNGFTPGALPGVISPISLVVNGADLYIGIDSGIAVIRNRP